MIHTELTKKAARIACNAHAGQTDKAGMPYIFHPFHVAEQMTDEICTCAALLHDVVEDTSVTAEQLAQEFPAEVVAAVRLLTRGEGEDYFEYIAKIKSDPVARAVKIADLKHNLDLSRLPEEMRTEEASRRSEKYAAALSMLMR